MAVAALVAVTGTAALGGLAAARRTASAHARLQAALNVPDLVVFGGDPADPENGLRFDDVAAMPEVAELGRGRLMLAGPEALAAADRLGLHVGDRVPIRTFTADDLPRLPELAADPNLPIGRRIAPVVVGIGVGDESIGDANQSIIGGPAFLQAHLESAGVQFAAIRLRRGPAGLDDFRSAFEQRFRRSDLLGGTRAQTHARVQRTVRPEVTALAAFAALAALIGLALTWQAIARQVRADRPRLDLLRALGFTRTQLAGVTFVPVVVAVAGGAAVAALSAALASPLGPVGVVRPLEPRPGILLDLPVLVAGPGLLALTALAGVGPVVWWSLRRRMSESRPRPAVPLTGLPLPVAAAVGMRRVLGRDRNGVPHGVAVAGLAVGVGALAATVTFAASLDRLVHTPRLYGWNYDAAVFDGYGALDDATMASVLAAEPAVAEFAARRGSSGSVGGQAAPFVAVDGTAFPPVLTAGRPPRADDEVVLGRRTRQRAHARVGATVEIDGADGTSRAFRVVGEAVMSEGEGAVFTPAGLRSVQPDAEVDTFPFRFRPGTDADAAAARLTKAFDYFPTGGEIDFPTRPADVTNLERVGSLPFLLAGILALGAIASLVHALAVALRRMQRDLAVLKSVGFTRRQVAATVAAQAVTLTGLGLLAGLPLGTAAGRWLWRLFAGELGVVPEPVTSIPFLLAVVPVAVLLALAVAALPARRASRLRPALVLRTE
ncbi:MAG TPA: ABC transporter permease [Acidimicrobiia bacterium]